MDKSDDTAVFSVFSLWPSTKTMELNLSYSPYKGRVGPEKVPAAKDASRLSEIGLLPPKPPAFSIY